MAIEAVGCGTRLATVGSSLRTSRTYTSKALGLDLQWLNTNAQFPRLGQQWNALIPFKSEHGAILLCPSGRMFWQRFVEAGAINPRHLCAHGTKVGAQLSAVMDRV